MISVSSTPASTHLHRPHYNTGINKQQNRQNFNDISVRTGSSGLQQRSQRVDQQPAVLNFNYPAELPFDYSVSLDFPTASNLDDALSTGNMHSDTWSNVAQFTPKMGRLAHQRESSLSSLGSTGPASPYTQNTSNPHIAVTDPANDSLSDVQGHDSSGANSNSCYQLAKSMNTYPGYQSLDSGMPDLAYPLTIPGPGSKPRMDRGLLPAPDMTSNGSSTRSHPASVASSVAGDSPATPSIGEPSDNANRRRNGFANAPKLDRTMTDVYSDELYNPNFSITSSASPAQSHSVGSPAMNSDLFHQRLNAANSQHLSAAHSPVSSTSRGRSPFQQGSPHAPSPNHDMMGSANNTSSAFNSAQRVREHSKADQDAQLYNRHMNNGGQPDTPKTISPKDAILEFSDADADTNFPLFPQDSSNFDMDQLTKAMVSGSSSMNHAAMLAPTTTNNHQFNYLSTQMQQNVHIPQQYPFIARPQISQDTPPRLSSSGSSSIGSGSSTPMNRGRPLGMTADGGTYTCTYHGCTLRFETPALLQKHKREGHRATQGLGNPRIPEGMTSNLLNSQAGPHRCDRINPSTGKPCNTVFSRPYDLTRHEDTIHNARKQKVRCNLCTEEKTFSRADALTRHYRVCHPDVELPGKHRRRGV